MLKLKKLFVERYSNNIEYDLYIPFNHFLQSLPHLYNHLRLSLVLCLKKLYHRQVLFSLFDFYFWACN